MALTRKSWPDQRRPRGVCRGPDDSRRLAAAVSPPAFLAALLAVLWCGPCGAVSAQPAVAGGVSVTDDAGRQLHLPAPATRVISLAPALTELVFAAGAGARLAGAVEYSDYPPAARDLPRVGDALALQTERILALKPDLILAWKRGNNPRQLERLADLGVPIYYHDVERLEDIATTLERLGVLLGSPAGAAAEEFRWRLRRLGQGIDSGAPPVKVFYQVWSRPLMTINGRHVISDLIGRCGGSNVFAAEPLLVPQVSVESVLVAAPEAIFAPVSAGAASESPLAQWDRHVGIPAVSRKDLFPIDGDAISRATPRLLDAGEAICRHLDGIRRRR